MTFTEVHIFFELHQISAWVHSPEKICVTSFQVKQTESGKEGQ